MSRSRQSSRPDRPQAADAPTVPSGDEALAVAGVAADFKSGETIRPHRHLRAQLVYAVEGVMTVTTEDGLWVVPPLRALWVPPGVAHSIRMTGRTRMRTVYFDEGAIAGTAMPARPVVLSVSALLREVIVRIVEADGDARRAAARERLVAVLLDELALSPVSPLEISMPSDPRLRRIADAILADPSDTRDAPDWARVAGTAERTLARLFPQQTGMTLVRWRQQVRLLRALERLALGEGVTTVALELGYTSTSAFVRMFRDSLGVTPGRYFDA